MDHDFGRPRLSAVFVDYDNVYLSLKRKSEDAATLFAKNTSLWLEAIGSGQLMTPQSSDPDGLERRLVMSRCYGNPVPKRNSHDNSTDMTCFPFVRHYFLQTGFEIIDCPPLTSQLKNSSDIRMVIDILDLLEHNTRFDEFIILSGDADFAPVLHRLRAHARRTVIYANDYTAAPYTAICDAEVREADLVSFLLQGQPQSAQKREAPPTEDKLEITQNDQLRLEIIQNVMSTITSSDRPLAIAYLADRAQKVLGHGKTLGSNWAGYGGFRTFLQNNLPEGIELTKSPPFYAYDIDQHQHQLQGNASKPPEPVTETGMASSPEDRDELPLGPQRREGAPLPPSSARPPLQTSEAPTPTPPAASLQQSITRIYEACQMPPLPPQSYKHLFEAIATELLENGLIGNRTINNILIRTSEAGLDIAENDVRFIVDVISQEDPWFEHGASADLFAKRYRNFVIARCQNSGLKLSIDELDLVDTWFGSVETGSAQPSEPAQQNIPPRETYPVGHPDEMAQPAQNTFVSPVERDHSRWWGRKKKAEPSELQEFAEQREHDPLHPNLEETDIGRFPRIIRSRMHG